MKTLTVESRSSLCWSRAGLAATTEAAARAVERRVVASMLIKLGIS